MKEPSFKELRKQFGGGLALRNYILSKSSLRVIWSPTIPRSVFQLHEINQVRIIIGGLCSKLPSIANSRVVRGYLKFDHKAAEHRTRGVSAPNPDMVVVSECLSELWQRTAPEELPEPCLFDSKNGRLFATIALGDLCSRMDSHNVVKFTCDWLQQIGLIENDRNLDALAFHKRDHGHPGAGFELTEILVTRAHFVEKRFAALAFR